MKILVVNGSPKGNNSTTLHTCLYLEQRFREHTFTYLNVGQHIRQMERDMSESLACVQDADMLLFCYPVYTFLVPSQLHRWLELLKQSGADLSGKVATQVTTSKHFYDITAHRFIADNCADMHVRYLEGLSQDMEDLLSPQGRMQAEEWLRLLLWQLAPITPVSHQYADKRAVVVADYSYDKAGTLRRMVEHFVEIAPFRVDVIEIDKFPLQGGCLGCFRCAQTGKCVYKDGFDDFLRNDIHQHDAILYAFTIRDHSMGYRMKMFDDRQFCNGHRTVTMGTPFGYIADGSYSREHNVRMLLEARAQVGGNWLAGVAASEENAEMTIEQLAARIAYAMGRQLTLPQNFYGVGGMKIFRDLIYMMRGLMRADHRFFKSHGQYDFPQKKWKTSLMSYLIGPMMTNHKLRAKLNRQITDGMIGPYRQVVEDAKTEAIGMPTNNHGR